LWSKANDDDIQSYQTVLDELLSDIHINNELINCTDLNCKSHVQCIDDLYSKICLSCVEAGKETIPQSRTGDTKTSKALPGWNDTAEPLRQEALYWHDMWKLQGSPREGELAHSMRTSRAKYHKQVKHLKSNQTQLRNQKLAESLSHADNRNFWKEIRHIKGTSTMVPSKIDDVAGDEAIVNVFSDKFKKLYNCVSYNQRDMHKLQERTYDQIRDKCFNSRCLCHCGNVTVHDIKQGLSKLKNGKKDGMDNLFTDHLIHGTHRLLVLLSLLYSVILCHGHCPSDMLFGVMCPIPKVKGTNKSENFRAITLCSVFVKLFDSIILDKCKMLLSTSDLQYGFKSGSSTGSCTFVVQEVISFFNTQGSNIYCTLLDASKAFDRLNLYILFSKLLNKGLCPVLVRALIVMYINQHLYVKWNGVMSDKFVASNGVKQGGIISPTLFCLYIDDLLVKLRKSGYGCYIGPHFCGALGYADDIILMSPSVGGMKRMLHICECYASSHFILFNGKKSQVIVFKSNNRDMLPNPELYLNGEVIPCVSKVKHLGHVLCNDIKGCIDLSYIGNCFNKSVNMLFADFGTVSSNVLSKLFTHYCCNFYGLALCDIRSLGFNKLYILWRKAVRRVLKLPRRAHNRLLPHLLCQSDLFTCILKRVTKFYVKLYFSEFSLVRFLSHSCMFQSISNMGKNVSLLDTQCNLSKVIHTIKDDNSLNTVINDVLNDVQTNIINNDDMYIIDICRELIDMRDGCNFGILDKFECIDLLYELTTS
jgi:hypothetical protein